MTEQDLTTKTCTPCEGKEDPFTRDEAETHLEQIHGWSLTNGATAIQCTYTREDFREALSFVNQVGEIAEDEGHHPDILIHSYNQVHITLSTHAIGGLSENDFIVAAKIDRANTSE